MNTSQKLRILREDKKLSQEEVANMLGIDRTTYAKYENGGSIKRNVQKLANFFNVSIDYLLGNDTSFISSPKPSLTPKDEQNIQKKLDNILNDLSPDSGLAYYNGDEPMSDEDKELLRISLENSLRLARQMAKQKFTPKKYRKD